MRKLLQLLAGAIGALSLVGLASAADMPAGKGPIYKTAPAPVFNWTGFYVGAQVGYGWGKTRWDNNVPFTTGDVDTDGGLAGATIGYNWQPAGSRFVLGVEGDLSWADISFSDIPASCGSACWSTIKSLATVRGRLGVAQNNHLFFVTGGVAIARVHYFNEFTIINFDRTEVGWTIGGGVETLLGRNWSLKAEYLYISLGRSDPLVAAVNLVAPYNDTHIVRGGLNYRF